MRYRCPYCHAAHAALPAGGRCSACGRTMRVPAPSSPAERAARRRRRARLVREGEIRREALGRVPNPRLLYSPRVMFALLLALCLASSLVIRRARSPAAGARPPELPQRLALRHLDTLATALGRYRFHTGAYPPPSPGLHALLDDPGVPGWNGPYVNQLLRDPWNAPYQYRLASNGTSQLFTCGPDGLPDTPDDLRPDPAAFDPGVAWTTGWVRASERLPGVRILPAPPAGGEPQ
jgi:hypothetical protein